MDAGLKCANDLRTNKFERNKREKGRRNTKVTSGSTMVVEIILTIMGKIFVKIF